MGAIEGYQMTLTYEIDQKELQSIVSRLGKLGEQITNKDILEKIALQVKTNIQMRTAAGKDVNYKPFKKYSKRYGAMKRSGVNLYLHGDMMNALTQKVISNDTAKIFFMTKQQADKARAHNNGEGNLPQREFFGVNPKDREMVYATYNQSVKENLRKLKL